VKPPPTARQQLDAYAFIVLLTLTALWGLNYTAIKISNTAVAPIFSSAIRSSVAATCGFFYCLKLQKSPFHRDIRLLHGIAVGLLFGLEFACLYLGTLWTDASRAVIFVYLSPFFVAMGAHFLLRGERLTVIKTLGLFLAFMGVLTLFGHRPASAGPRMWLGDLLEIAAAFFWATTTLYIKRFMADKVHPIQTFFYQLSFSIPVLFALSFLLESSKIWGISPLVVGSLAYQSLIVAFWSYYLWFKLIHLYPVSDLSSFTFFTPVFGVLFGGLLLGEETGVRTFISLAMVSGGIFLVNRPGMR